MNSKEQNLAILDGIRTSFSQIRELIRSNTYEITSDSEFFYVPWTPTPEGRNQRGTIALYFLSTLLESRYEHRWLVLLGRLFVVVVLSTMSQCGKYLRDKFKVNKR